jgi:hypothetical protein
VIAEDDVVADVNDNVIVVVDVDGVVVGDDVVDVFCCCWG